MNPTRVSRVGPAVAVAIYWNGLLGLAVWLNGGFGQLRDPRALGVAAVACLGVSLAALFALGSKSGEPWFVKPGASAGTFRTELLLVAMATGLMGPVTALMAAGIL